jgi:flagella synthesis protein FlgN
MSNQKSLWSDLHQTLSQDLSLTEQLLIILKQERSALEEREYSSLKTNLETKKGLLGQLEQNAKLRSQQLYQAGFQDEARTLAAAKTAAPTTAKLWQQLRQQWTQCQEFNEINDRIAQRTRLVVRQILDIMRGQENNARTYSAQGYTQNISSGQSISRV